MNCPPTALMRLNLRRKPLAFCASLLLLCGCDGSLWGDESRLQKPLEGERIAVLAQQSALRPDPELSETALILPQAQLLREFPSQMLPQQRGAANLSLTGFDLKQRASVGDGESWESPLIPSPVMAGDVIYAMDAGGTITAHDAANVGRILWRAQTRLPYADEDEALAGGGLSYRGGVLYATTAYGSVIALVAADGSLLWRQETHIPIRSAPTSDDNQLYVITIDNQLHCFAARTGRPLWTHRGIRESAVYLGSADPVSENGIVIAAFSSGEIIALRAEDGSPLWSDSLIAPRRTSAAAMLTGISATPLISDNFVYALSNNGLMAASLLSTGRGIWDLELAASRTPWVSGDYLFVLGSDHHLYAVHRGNRRIRWITNLIGSDESSTDDAPSFSAPIMVNGQILLIDAKGEMLFIEPKSGSIVQRLDAPANVYTRPIIAGGRMYLIDASATLYQYE